MINSLESQQFFLVHYKVNEQGSTVLKMYEKSNQKKLATTKLWMSKSKG